MTKEETKAEVPTQSQPPKKNGRQQTAGRRQNQKAKTLPKLNENQKPAAQTTAAAAPARAMLPFSAREVSTRGRVLRDSSVMNTRGEK